MEPSKFEASWNVEAAGFVNVKGALSLTIGREPAVGSFPKILSGSGKRAGSRSAMLRIRCARRGLMTAASIIWSFWANGQITGAGRDYCYYIAAADSVESWLYFSQSLSPDLDPFVRLSALRSRSLLLSSSPPFLLSRDLPNDPLTTQIALRRRRRLVLAI